MKTNPLRTPNHLRIGPKEHDVLPPFQFISVARGNHGIIFPTVCKPYHVLNYSKKSDFCKVFSPSFYKRKKFLRRAGIFFAQLFFSQTVYKTVSDGTLPHPFTSSAHIPPFRPLASSSRGRYSLPAPTEREDRNPLPIFF